MGGLDSSPLQGSLWVTQPSHNLSGDTQSRDLGSYGVLPDTASPVVTVMQLSEAYALELPFPATPAAPWTSEPALLSLQAAFPLRIFHGVTEKVRVHREGENQISCCPRPPAHSSEPALSLHSWLSRSFLPGNTDQLPSLGELAALNIALSTAIGCHPPSGC